MLRSRSIELDDNGASVALDVGGATPGAGFPGVGSPFQGSTKLISPRTICFVADSDDDLSTFETFPTGRQIKLRISTAVRAAIGNYLRNAGLAMKTVGPDTTGPEVATTPPPLNIPLITPGQGDTDVDHLSRKYNLPAQQDWYKHEVQAVCENDNAKILWDFSIQTDKVIHARRPDIVVVDKVKNTISIIDIAIPADRNICEKQEEKVTKYQDLRLELSRMWKKKNVTIIPVVVGALGSIPKRLKEHLAKLDLVGCECRMLQ